MVSSEAQNREFQALQDLFNMRDRVIAIGCDIAFVRCLMRLHRTHAFQREAETLNSREFLANLSTCD